MHDEQPTAILTQGLSDLRWGVDAAAALYGIWSHDNPSDKGRVFGWNDFSKHLSDAPRDAPWVHPQALISRKPSSQRFACWVMPRSLMQSSGMPLRLP